MKCAPLFLHHMNGVAHASRVMRAVHDEVIAHRRCGSPKRLQPSRPSSPLQINKLLGMYEQRSGQSVQSPGFNMNSFAQFATEQTGQSMPTEIIEQLVKWKVPSFASCAAPAHTVNQNLCRLSVCFRSHCRLQPLIACVLLTSMSRSWLF